MFSGTFENDKVCTPYCVWLVASAAEYPLYSQGITPSFTEMEVCDWIDDIGGMGGQKFQDVMSALSQSMNSGIDDKPTKSSKKDGVKKN